MPATPPSHFTYHTRSRFGVLHPEVSDAHRWLWANVPRSAARLIAKHDGMAPPVWRKLIATIQQAQGANALRIQRDAERRNPQSFRGGSPGDRGTGGGAIGRGLQCPADLHAAEETPLVSATPRAAAADPASYLIDDRKSVTAENPAFPADPTTDTIEQRVMRYARFRRQALDQAVYLDELDPCCDAVGGHPIREIADNLRRCGSYLVFHRYDDIGENRLHAARFCQNGRLCAFCSMRRMVRKVARVAPIAFQAIRDTGTTGYLVTLTVKNGVALDERLSRLRDADRRLHERGRNWRSFLAGNLKRRPRYTEWHKVIGQLWSIEIKKGSGSNLWHPHMHSLCLCTEPMDAAALSAEWRELTGDSFIVDVRPLHAMRAIEQGAGIDEVRDQLAADLMEVISYALKFSTMGPASTWHAYTTCYGRQLSRCRGVLYGCDVRDEYLDAPLAVEDLPFVEVIARWAGDRYDLEAADDWGTP